MSSLAKVGNKRSFQELHQNDHAQSRSQLETDFLESRLDWPGQEQSPREGRVGLTRLGYDSFTDFSTTLRRIVER